MNKIWYTEKVILTVYISTFLSQKVDKSGDLNKPNNSEKELFRVDTKTNSKRELKKKLMQLDEVKRIEEES